MALSILIVDDSKFSRMMLYQVVENVCKEWQITETATGVETLKLFESATFEVALIDYNMPDMNGLDLGRQLRQRFPQMPIGLITANLQLPLKKRAEGLEIEHISKPLTPDRLKEFLGKAGIQPGNQTA